MALEDKAVRGVPWTVVTYGASKGISLISTVVLARLLVPADFGLVALSFLTMNAIGLFRDLGLGGALILRQDIDRREQGTVLTLMLTMSVVIALIVIALAPLAEDLFRAPRLAGVLRLLSLTLVLGAFNWFYEIVMQRSLNFGRRFVSMTTMSVVYAAVAIVLATVGAGVWSIVGGHLAGWSVQAVVSLLLAPYRVRPAFDMKAARESIAIGRGFMAQGGLTFLQQNADYLAVGRVLGAAQVGFYSMAYRLSEVPYWAISDAVAKVTFPAFARMRHEGRSVVPSFLSTLRMVALVTCPMGVILSASADPFTRVVFGDKWLPMIGALAVLGIWSSVRTVQSTTGWLLNSVGQAGLMGWLSAAVLVPLVPGLFLAADLGGIAAVSWVMLADMLLSLALLTFFASRRAGVRIADQWRALRPVAIAGVLCWVAARAVVEIAGSIPAAVALTASIAAGLAVYALVVSLVEPGLLRYATGQALRMLRRAPSAAAERPDRVAEEITTGVERM
jgi:PST family polysaccharide transporter